MTAGKLLQGERFSFHCLCVLPDLAVSEEVASTIALIDVLWFEKGANRVACGFEVEKSMSIYSGHLRLADLLMRSALPFNSPSRRPWKIVLHHLARFDASLDEGDELLGGPIDPEPCESCSTATAR